MNFETRITNGDVELRDIEGKPTISGYAAVFESHSRDFGGFTEIIERGAFDDVLDNDETVALFNHDFNIVLGRSGAGTLKLTVDERGLRYDVTPPSTGFVNDMVLEPMKRGDINQSSFAFRVADEAWEKRDGNPVRVIKRMAELQDVSVVTLGAYPDTNSAVRSYNKFVEADKTEIEFSEERSMLDLPEDIDIAELLTIMRSFPDENATVDPDVWIRAVERLTDEHEAYKRLLVSHEILKRANAGR